MRERPTSPHLGVYKMSRYTLASSIFNRFTGVALSVGLIVLVYWLMAVAGGSHAYQRAAEVLGSPLLKFFYAAMVIAFAYHLVAGIRHLVWDTGRGLERAQSKRSAGIVVVISILIAAALLCWVFICGGHAL
jgi:succinate dehydrogenase / fumarate reductase cytochrome b subunit